MNNGMLDLLQDDQLSHKMSSFHFILNSLYRVKLQKSDLQTALLIFLMLAGGPDVPLPPNKQITAYTMFGMQHNSKWEV